MTATVLPFVRPEDMELPGKRGYSVLSDDLARRLKAAEQAEHDATTPAQLEAAVAETEAVWREIDALEADERDAATERDLDSRMSVAEEIR